MKQRAFLPLLLLLAGLAFAGGAGESADDSADGAAVRALVDARGVTVAVPATNRIVTLGGAVTETAYALGAEERIVGVDESSLYPPRATEDKPTVGYVRQVSVEGLLSLEPELVITTEDLGPPEALDQLSAVGVPVFVVPGEDSFAGAVERVQVIGEVLGTPDRAADLIAEMEADIERGTEIAAAAGTEPRVLFIYARGAGTLLASGTDTSAEAMIELAGGRNVISGYRDYRPLTPEAAAAAEPDVILFTTSGLASLGGPEAARGVPGLNVLFELGSPAILSMEDLYLLGFGPRTGAAVADLAELLASVSRD